MKKLVDHNLKTLHKTLEALVSWEQSLIELTKLCCILLPCVMDCKTAEQALIQKVICLLCQIAFRHPILDVKTHDDPLSPGTLKKLFSNSYGGVKVDNNLVSSLVSIPWSNDSKFCILEMVLNHRSTSVLSSSSPTTAPDSSQSSPTTDPVLSQPSLTIIVTTLGTAQLSLVERLSHGA